MRDHNVVCNMYISRNLATLRENMCAMSSHVNGTLVLCYACEAYRDKCPQKTENTMFSWPSGGDSDGDVMLILSLIMLVDDEDVVG